LNVHDTCSGDQWTSSKQAMADGSPQKVVVESAADAAEEASGAAGGAGAKKGSTIWGGNTNNLWHCGECFTECEVGQSTCIVCGAAKPSGVISSVPSSPSSTTASPNAAVADGAAAATTGVAGAQVRLATKSTHMQQCMSRMQVHSSAPLLCVNACTAATQPAWGPPSIRTMHISTHMASLMAVGCPRCISRRLWHRARLFVLSALSLAPRTALCSCWETNERWSLCAAPQQHNPIQLPMHACMQFLTAWHALTIVFGRGAAFACAYRGRPGRAKAVLRQQCATGSGHRCARLSRRTRSGIAHTRVWSTDNT
jgi:hypothetical protein